MAAAAKISIRVMAMVIGIPVSLATRKAVETAWNAAHPDQPPREPSERGVRWPDAIVWGALSAVGVVVADLITTRSAETAYRAITGNAPPPRKPSKAEKRAKQAREKAGVVED